MGKQLVIFGLGFIAIMSLRISSLTGTATASRNVVYTEYEHVMARNTANSAVEYALYMLTQDPDWRDGMNSPSYNGAQVGLYLIDRPDISDETVELIANASYGRSYDAVEAIVELERKSNRFSRYAYFSNREAGIWFTSRDTLFGPIHTNDQFNLSGNPMFYGLVSSTAETYNTMGPTDPNFMEGTNFGIPRINIQPEFTGLSQVAGADGHKYLAQPLHIRLLEAGGYEYRDDNDDDWTYRDLPPSGVIFCNRDIYLEGTLSGQVTIVSNQSVIITNSVTYADDPRINPDSMDLLGIVAFDDVIVQDNENNIPNCTIEASILAKNGSFTAENYQFEPTGRLELYGGVVQERRGPVGQMGDPPVGYDKYYHFDERMETLYPPYYPEAVGSVSDLARKANIKIVYWKNSL